MIAQLLLKVRVDGRTPLLWHRSRVLSLHKKSIELVSVPYDSQSVVHGLCPVGMGVYAHMYDRSVAPSPQPFENG